MKMDAVVSVVVAYLVLAMLCTFVVVGAAVVSGLRGE